MVGEKGLIGCFREGRYLEPWGGCERRTKKVKMKLYEKVVIPTVIYGSETCTGKQKKGRA